MLHQAAGRRVGLAVTLSLPPSIHAFTALPGRSRPPHQHARVGAAAGQLPRRAGAGAGGRVPHVPGGQPGQHSGPGGHAGALQGRTAVLSRLSVWPLLDMQTSLPRPWPFLLCFLLRRRSWITLWPSARRSTPATSRAAPRAWPPTSGSPRTGSSECSERALPPSCMHALACSTAAALPQPLGCRPACWQAHLRRVPLAPCLISCLFSLAGAGSSARTREPWGTRLPHTTSPAPAATWHLRRRAPE